MVVTFCCSLSGECPDMNSTRECNVLMALGVPSFVKGSAIYI